MVRPRDGYHCDARYHVFSHLLYWEVTQSAISWKEDEREVGSLPSGHIQFHLLMLK